MQNKRIGLVFGVALLVLGSAVVMSYSSGLIGVFKHLLTADTIWIALIIGAQSLAYWAYIIPYKLVFKLDFKQAKIHAFEGFQPFTPGGGFVYDLKLHKPLGTQARVYYLGLWEYAALAPAVLIAAIYAYIFSSVPAPLSLPWIIGVPLGAVLFTVAVVWRQRLAKFPRATRLIDLMLGMLKDQSWKQIAALMLGMVGYWCGEIFALWGALQLFDIRLSWVALFIAYATGYSITRRSLPLAGAGIVLVSLSLSLHWVGAALSVAVLAALAYQISNIALPLMYHHASISLNDS